VALLPSLVGLASSIERNYLIERLLPSAIEVGLLGGIESLGAFPVLGF
jgi:hypothetical protein